MLTTSAEADPVFSDLLSQMDTSAAKYSSDSCVAARKEASDYSENPTAEYAEGYALGYAFGLLAIPMAMGAVAHIQKMENDILDHLAEGCGAETFLPYVKAKTLENNAKIQRWLGLGFASEQEWPQAIQWYGRAAGQHDADAETSLGSLYAAGNGVPVDDAQAVVYWKRADDDGSVAAKGLLAGAYLHGKGVAEDQNEAVRLYREAADAADAAAQYNLGLLYESGTGVSQSDVSAYKWFEIAVLNGDKDATAKRDEAQSHISRQSADEAYAQIQECKKHGFHRCG